MNFLTQIPKISVQYWPFSLLAMVLLMAYGIGPAHATFGAYAAFSGVALIALLMVIHGIGRIIDAISEIHF